MLWFGGEITTAIMAVVVLGVVYGDEAEHYLLAVYPAAFAGAALGAVAAFQIVKALPARGDGEDDGF